MQLQDIKNLFEYNDWANDILIDMLTAAFGEKTDLRATGEPMTRVIQETATHIVAAQHIWQLRWIGTSLTEMLSPEIFPTTTDLRNAFHTVRKGFWIYFNHVLTEDALSGVIAYKNTRGAEHALPLAAMMQHVVNHSSYHRGQITARLMTLGHDDVIQSTDFSTWTMLKAKE